jgi:hypothetical protein
MDHLRITVIVCATLCTHAALAQQAHSLSNTFRQKETALQQWQHGQRMGGKATTTGSRLISLLDMENDGSSYLPADSNQFYYSGSRGGDLNHIMKYDSGVAFNYSAGNYDLSMSAAQSFDANDNIVGQHIWQWNNAASSWDNYEQASLEYDLNNNLLKTTIQDWDQAANAWVNSYRDSSLYDANNNEITHTWQEWDQASSSWTNNEEDLYTYNANNELYTTFIKTWNTAQNKWDSTIHILNIRNANDSIMLTSVQIYNAATHLWELNSKDTFTYDAMNNLLTDESYNWNMQLNDWLPNNLTTYGSFVGHAPQTAIEQHWDNNNQVFTNYTQTLNTYNNYEQLTSDAASYWSNGNWTDPQYGGRYHYEPYTLQVKELSGMGGSATIYPVPASNEITVNVYWDEPQQGNISVLSMNGSVLKNSTLVPGYEAKQTINVSDLPTGNYLVKISGAKGSTIQKLSIIH